MRTYHEGMSMSGVATAPYQAPAAPYRARARGFPRSEKPRYAWLTLPSIVGVFIACLTLAVMRPADRPAGAFAIVNVAVTIALSYRFLKVNPTVGMIPAFFIMPMMVLTSISTLYFCMFSPDTYVTPWGTAIRLLDTNDRFQLATLLSIISFSIPWLLFEGRERPPMTYDAFLQHAHRMAKPVFFFFIAFIALMVVLRLLAMGPSSAVGYLIYGLFRYGHGLPLIPGAAWHTLGRRTKTVIIAVLAVNFLFNTFTNSRYYAFMPLVYFGFGLLFLSRISTQRKLGSLVVLIALFGVALVVGNAGRRLGLGLWHGGSEDLQRRYDVLTQKMDKLVDKNWGEEIFVRLFFTGGHQIVMLVPDVYPYKPVNVGYYLAEVVSQGLLPRKLAIRLVPPLFEDKATLIAIGHRITESHSVERSFVGAAWEMGGPLFVFLVSLLTGFYTLLMTRVLQTLFAISGSFGVVVFAVACDRVFASVNEGLPTVAHEMAYGIVIGGVLYFVILILLYFAPGRRRVSLAMEQQSGALRL